MKLKYSVPFVCLSTLFAEILKLLRPLFGSLVSDSTHKPRAALKNEHRFATVSFFSNLAGLSPPYFIVGSAMASTQVTPEGKHLTVPKIMARGPRSYPAVEVR